MSEDARRTYELPSKMLQSKKTVTQLKEEKGEKTLEGAGEKPTEFRSGVLTGKTKEQARKESSQKTKKTEPTKATESQFKNDRKESEPTPILGKTVAIVPLDRTGFKRSALNKPDKLYKDVIQGLYQKSKFPSQSKQKEYLKSQGYESRTKYQAGSVEEALTRIAYAGSEIVAGGIEELTLGLAKTGAENRPGSITYRIVGGLAAPSALDYAAGMVFSKLAIQKNGRALLKKIIGSSDEPMWASRQIQAQWAKNFEKLKGKNNWSTDDMRNAVKQLKKLDIELGTWEAGWSNKFSPEELRIIEKIKGKSGWSVDEIRNGTPVIKKVYKLALEPKEYIIDTPKDRAMWEKIVGKSGITTSDLRKLTKSDLKETMQRIVEYYEKNPNAPRLAQVAPEINVFDDFMQEAGYYSDGYINMLKKYGDLIDPNLAVSIFFSLPVKERERLLEDVADYNLTKQPPKTEDAVKQTPTREPALKETPEETPEQTPIETPEQTPIETPDISLPQEPIPPEELPETKPDEKLEPTEPTPPLILTEKEKQERKALNLKLYNGPEEKYRVKYIYKQGKTETLIVQANSIIEATATAQRIKKPNKTLPKLMDIKRVK